MKKLTLLFIIPFAIIMADMHFPTSTQKGDSMSTVSTEAVPVNTSGIIPNSVDLIWADMHDAPTGYPVATNSSYGQFKGPVFKGFLPTGIDGWGSVNAWFEVEPGTDGASSCGAEAGTSANTAVELSPIYAWVLYKSGEWIPYAGINSPFKGSTHPSEHILFKENRGCNVEYIENIRAVNVGYNALIAPRTYLPQYYFRYHGWATNRHIINKAAIKAVFFTYFARLVKIDPNGPDDFDKSEFIVHGASDIKAEDGTQVPGAAGWGIGGISRFKTVPKNGDWMPTNFLEGWITKEELAANPPPFPKHP